MQGTAFVGANREEMREVFKYLDGCLEKIVMDNELGALTQVEMRHVLSDPPHLAAMAVCWRRCRTCCS